jgi:queuosine precursor transporter
VRYDKATGLTVLTGIFVAALVTSTLIGSKLILLSGVSVSAGILVFPFTFLSLDVAADCYGKSTAKTIIRVGILVQIFVLFFVWLGGMLPASPLRDMGPAYEQVFSLTGRMILASVSAYLCSQILDITVFLQVKEITGQSKLWLRTNVATLTSQLIDTAVFTGIFLGGVIPFSELLQTGATMYAVKIILGFVDTPFVYLGRRLFGAEESAR